MSSKKHKRFKLLLDEGVHLPQKYPTLNNLHNVVHVSNVRMQGKSDEKVFQFATNDSRLMVVFNAKDFKRFVESGKPSVIVLSTNLSNEEADLKICKALKNLKQNEIKGHLISISKSGILITALRELES